MGLYRPSERLQPSFESQVWRAERIEALQPSEALVSVEIGSQMKVPQLATASIDISGWYNRHQINHEWVVQPSSD